jgi:hypothetical protein
MGPCYCGKSPVTTSWVPDWAKYFTVENVNENKSVQIHFYGNSLHLNHRHPIDQLPAMLCRRDVVQQIADKPLADRLVATGAVTADEILQRGADHIRDRAATRDQSNGERTMKQVVNAFNAIFGTQITEEQGWQFMVILKIVRSANGKVNIDDYEDEAAYAALAAESALSERA